MKISNIICYVLLLSNFSCKGQTENEIITTDDNSQFAVEGGIFQPFKLGATSSPFGYFLFTPDNYRHSDNNFPLLIFLHGYGERGNSKTNPDNLDRILSHGPVKLIRNNEWNPGFDMIVASPQCHDDWWESNKIKQFIEYLIKTYNVNQSRIYLTGLSMGGFATFDILSKYGDNLPVAAAVPICGSGVLSETNIQNMTNIPLWVFHGNDDSVVSPEYSKAIVPAINGSNPEYKAKLTIYPGIGHDSWTMTYSGKGKGHEDNSYDPFDLDIYQWMYQYVKN